jgi:hypothetical protein
MVGLRLSRLFMLLLEIVKELLLVHYLDYLTSFRSCTYCNFYSSNDNLELICYPIVYANVYNMHVLFIVKLIFRIIS